MRLENTWHEIRDHSFIQNHSRSFRFTASPLQFTHLLQGSGQRTPDTRSETIPSSRITPDLQIHSFSSSVHSSSTGFRSENTWHEIRDHSFIQNHSRSSDSQLLLFSSLIFYRVQIREHLTRDQRPCLHPESLQILQIHSFSSSVHSSSTGFRSENTWHEIRDHSFIQNHSRSFRFTASPLQFTHLLQGSGQRTPDTRSETIPSSRITPDPSDSQLLLFSSPHSCSTGFRSEEWNGRSRSLVLCLLTHFCVVFEVCVWIIVRLEDPIMAHYKISNRVNHLLIFNLLVFDRIHNSMCLNKISRTSSRNIGPQHQKYSSIFHCTHCTLFIPVFTEHILSVCC